MNMRNFKYFVQQNPPSCEAWKSAKTNLTIKLVYVRGPDKNRVGRGYLAGA